MLFNYRIFIIIVVAGVVGGTLDSSTDNEKCILKCYEQTNQQRSIGCDFGSLSSYRPKRSERSERIIFEHPISFQLPKRVEHLRCLKTFSCHPEKTSTSESITISTTTTKPFEPDDTEEVTDKIDSIYDDIRNESLEITPGKMEELLSNLNEIIKNITDNNVDMINITYSSLMVMDNLVGRSQTWQNMTNDEQLKNSDHIFNLADNLAGLMNRKLNQSIDADVGHPIVKIECKNIQLHSKYSKLLPNQSLVYEMNTTRLLLPSMGLMVNNESSDTSMDEMKLSSTASIISNKNLISRICDDDKDDKDGYQLLNTPIISMVIGHNNDQSIRLNEPYYFSLETTNFDRLVFGDRPSCYYWNVTRKCWSSDGCYYRKIESNRSASICECNHLTSIVIIVDIYNRDGDDPIKTWLTRVTSSATILCTMIALYISIRYNRETLNVLNDQFRTRSNLFLLNCHAGIWLIVAHIIIIFGLEREQDEPNILCQSISLMLLFSLLAMICFTFLKCFHCSWFIVFAPLGVSISSRNYLLIGYSSPIIIIFSGLLYFYATETQIWQDVLESLCGRYFCWISSYEYTKHIWLFLGPLFGLFALNVILFTLIMYRYCTSPIHNRSSKTKHLFSVMFNAFFFFINFGCTWLLAIIYINEELTIPYLFSIMFILLNGSQGIFLLIEQIFRFVKQKNRIRQTKTMSTKLRTSISINNNSSNISYGSGSGLSSTTSLHHQQSKMDQKLFDHNNNH